jgi:hypothetical protein
MIGNRSVKYAPLTQRELSIMQAFGALPNSESAVQPDAAQPAASFSLLGRVAASLWFVILAILFAKGLTATIRALPPLGHYSGEDSFILWAAVVSRCCTLVFYATLGGLILIRPRPFGRREGVVPLIVSFCGTYGVWLAPFLLRPFLLKPGGISPAFQIAAAGVTLFGSLSIIIAVLHLRRSFSIAPQARDPFNGAPQARDPFNGAPQARDPFNGGPQARKLVVGGPYRLVRHPLYVAEEIALIGFLMQYAWYAAVAFLILHMGFQIRRMMYEESLLRAVFPDYDAYARRTARLIPGIW